VTAVLDALLERRLIPDALLRVGVRRAIARRLRQQRRGGPVAEARRKQEFIDELRRSPVAIHAADANAQHYDVPAEFFEQVLGRRLKYSCAWWEPGTSSLDDAEEAMLRLYEERAQLEDGQRVLDLGCGWGSLSLWLAERHRHSAMVAVSNSCSQAAFIRARARERGLSNIDVRTSDVCDFDPGGRFDRVVSIEMFEHLRNYGAVLSRIARWLEADGALFVHHFSHRHLAYPYEDKGPGDWMARHFFTGGIMPSHDLLLRFDVAMRVEEQWRIPGRHYARTAEAWLSNMDANEAVVRSVFARTYGDQADRFWAYWRLFFIAVAELWSYQGGAEWIVSHHRLRRAEGCR